MNIYVPASFKGKKAIKEALRIVDTLPTQEDGTYYQKIKGEDAFNEVRPDGVVIRWSGPIVNTAITPSDNRAVYFSC